jgi:hypothetical protein
MASGRCLQVSETRLRMLVVHNEGQPAVSRSPIATVEIQSPSVIRLATDGVEPNELHSS